MSLKGIQRLTKSFHDHLVRRSVHRHIVKKLAIGAMIGFSIAGLSGCASPLVTTPTNTTNASAQFTSDSSSEQQAIINSEEVAYLKSKGNLLAIQADKRIQHINATQKQRYPIPYTRSSDGNYWSWFTDHYLPKSVIKEVLQANQSDAPSSMSDGQAGYDANKFNNEIQKNLGKHGVNYGINYAILGNSASNALDAYNNGSSSDLPMKYYSSDTHMQQMANDEELDYLQDSGNAKAKKADKKVEEINKKHHQKYPLPYTKYPDGNYWSWFQQHQIPSDIISKFYQAEISHDSDHGLSDDSGYSAHRFDDDIQYNLMKHNVNYGVNYSRLSSKIANKMNKYEQD